MIYGIATTEIRNAQEYHTGPNPRYVVAFRDSDGQFVVIDSLSLDSYRVDKWFDYYGRDPNTGGWNHHYAYCYEYYFEHPIPRPSTENIFIGHIMDSIGNTSSSPAQQTRGFAGRLPDGTIEIDRWWRTLDSVNWQDEGQLMIEYGHSLSHTLWGVYFPIIRPDSLLCGRVENFRLEERETDHVKLAWETTRPFRDLHSGRFQIALGGLGPRPDTTNILTFNDTTATLTGLDSGVWYSAWVRGECCHCGCPMHGDTLIWGPWRGPVQFYLGSHQPGTQGIATTDGGETLFSLSPNPASGTVTVEVDRERLQGAFLQVVNLEGHIVAESMVETSKFDIDISALPAGVYLVHIYTPEGTATRRLVVK